MKFIPVTIPDEFKTVLTERLSIYEHRVGEVYLQLFNYLFQNPQNTDFTDYVENLTEKDYTIASAMRTAINHFSRMLISKLISSNEPLLINGVKHNKINPLTFRIPSKDRIKSLKVGDMIKIGLEAGLTDIRNERPWVQILSIDKKNNFTVQIMNNLIFTYLHGLINGDKIVINSKNILSTE